MKKLSVAKHAPRRSVFGPPNALWAAVGCVFGLSLLFSTVAIGQSRYAALFDEETSGTNAEGGASSAPARALKQDADALKPVTLRLRGATVEDALRRIAREAGLRLSYSSEAVAGVKRVTLNLKQTPALAAIKMVIQGMELKVAVTAKGQLILFGSRGNRKAEVRALETLPVLEHLRAARLIPVRIQIQTGTIAGTVTDSTTGEPLPGVNVVIAGTQRGAATDAEGRFVISELDPGAYDLVASFIGYATKRINGVTVTADDTTFVDIALGRARMGLDEVVVIGYGTALRRDVTGSIGSIEVSEAVETRTLTNVAQLLQGRVPGLHAGIATEADGETTLRVRGQTSINAGNDPLLVVDGVPYQGSLSSLNPNDIASIDVLKGASAAAVYGASAAAGVIAITTKQGQTAEPTIRFKSSLGIATQGELVPPYSPAAYIRYMRDARRRLRPTAPDYYYADPRNLPSEITLDEWLALGEGGGEPMEIWLGRIGLQSNEIQNYLDGKTIDWHDQVYRSAALRQNYNLSVSGKPEYVSYYLSMGYADNQGEVVGERFRTVRARMNLSATPADWLEVGLNSWYANQNRGFLGADAGEVPDASPYGDMYEEDGTLKWYPHGDLTAVNPFLSTTQSGRRYEWRNHNLSATLHADVDLPLGLGYQVRWANDYTFRRDYLFDPSTVPWGRPAGVATREEYTGYIWTVDNILTWNRTIADIHSFDATFLFGVEVEENKATTAYNDEFPLESLGYGGLPLGANPSVSSNDTRATGTALMGRLNYQLLGRYLFTVSYRRDGYSAFGQQHPYAYFPAAAFAWRLSEEPFFDVDAVSNLKLRLSWGVNGNRSIGTYSALQQLVTGKYIYGTETVTGVSASNLPNLDLKWERTTQYNVGLDFGLFSGRLSGSVDAYYMSTTNLLLRRRLPEITGYDDIWSNLGEVVNRGLELSLSSVNLQNENLFWESTLNFSLNRNEIKHLYGTQVPVLNEAGVIVGYREADDRENGWFIRHSLHQIYDYKVLGIWQQDEAEEAARYGREPGDFKLLDVNGDGVLTPIEDKVFQGYTNPRYRISLINDVSYKNFTASALITSYLGYYTAHDVHKHLGVRYGRINVLAYPYWTPENPTNEWARLASQGQNPDFSYWENTSFLRLQSLSLAYQIPQSLTSRFGSSNLRVFFNARNVFVLTGYDGADPETREHTPRLYTLGINLTL